MSEAVLMRVVSRFPEAIVSTDSLHGDETVVLKHEHLADVARFCHDDPECDLKLPLSVTCVDYIGESPRFELVYTLYSISRKHRLRLKVRVPDETLTVPSVMGVWPGMDYWERYCFDMYGVQFSGRTKPLKRLWLYEEFVGFPLRKDYPLRGRQPLLPERDIQDISRGPGPGFGSSPADRSPTPAPGSLRLVK